MPADPTWAEEIKAALLLHQQGDLTGARQRFQTILSRDPNQPDAHHGLGMIYAELSDFQQARIHLAKAVQLAPWVAEFHNNLGNAYKALGQADAALTHYQQALRLKPTYPQAHNNLGTLLYRLGKYPEASQHFEKSLRMDPQSVDTHYNAANCYIQQDRLLDALAHYQAVLALRSDHLGAQHNMGVTLCALKRFEEAKPHLLYVAEREKNNIDALFYLGVIEGAWAHAEQAKNYYEQVLAIDPNHANSHHNLATIYLHLHDLEKAKIHFKEALRLQPHNKTAAHMLTALEGKTATEGAPYEYTRALFDQYAYSYDSHVKEKLKYRVPALLRQIITPFVENPKRSLPWEILDLGCGTGLCAPLFSDVAQKLIGVDLSPGMIEVARMQGGYYKLYTMDIESYLASQNATFDLILAADVFVYFGDLDKVFSGIHRALRKEGLFCFSIETLLSEEIKHHPTLNHFQLRPTGRYAHHPNYIHTLCQQIPFEILVEKSDIIRYQEDQGVQGSLFILRRKSS